MSFVLRAEMEAYKGRLEEFDFEWTNVYMPEQQANDFREREWELFFEAEQLGIEAVQLFRKYQVGLA